MSILARALCRSHIGSKVFESHLIDGLGGVSFVSDMTGAIHVSRRGIKIVGICLIDEMSEFSFTSILARLRSRIYLGSKMSQFMD